VDNGSGDRADSPMVDGRSPGGTDGTGAGRHHGTEEHEPRTQTCPHADEGPDKGRPPLGGRAGVVVRPRPGGRELDRSGGRGEAAASRAVPTPVRRQTRNRPAGTTYSLPILDPVDKPGPPRTAARTAAFFDLDKTIIAKSSTLAFSRSFYQGGLINRRTVLRSAYAQFVYLVGGADHDQMERMRQYLSSMATGWDVTHVKDIVAETLHELIDPLVYDEAATLVEEHHRAGRDVVVVSSSGAEVVEPIGEMIGADKVVATQMVVGDDGRYTGEIAYYAYGEHKATAVRELADSEGYDLTRSYAYSDSVTDLPMLTAVGHPYAVNPDRALRRECAQRGWPVLVFSKPVSLRSRFRIGVPPRPALLATALGAATAAAGLVWYAARRRERRRLWVV
jgi:HAD superfamily hydrolase (TIGR01490 family)